MSFVRLDKILSANNICSRQNAAKLIKTGAVTVNGIIPKKADVKIDTENDVVKFKDKIIKDSFVYLMMNKPKDVVSAVNDNLHKTVIDILPEKYQNRGLFPVGRLDIDTEGLLIITNDGDYCHKVTSPKKNIYKTYFVQTDKPINQDIIDRFSDKIILNDGTVCKSAILKNTDGGALVSITEGKFHQVKKMFLACGLKVEYLKRVSVGELRLDENLLPGEIRVLNPDEYIKVFE